MQETICKFGKNESLFGILTSPFEDQRVEDAPIAIFLNAGIVHRIGPFRLHVDLARQFAKNGFSNFRLDLSGLGDSEARTGKVEAESRAEMDVADAMDYLTQETGVEKFVVIGLCSGAYNAHQVALKDPRIVGGAFLDGIVFRTTGFYFRHYFLRLLRPRFWRNFIKRRLSRNKSTTKNDGEVLGESEFFSDDLSHEQVKNEIHTIVDRGVETLFIYTGGFDDVCGKSQFKEMFGLEPNDQSVQVEYYPNAEHTFRIVENRKLVCERISDWYQNRFSVPSLVSS